MKLFQEVEDNSTTITQLGDKNIWNEDKIWAILTPGLPQALADNEGRKGYIYP